MPSIAENKRLVQESLGADTDHAAIIDSLRDEIDRHNRNRSAASSHGAEDRTRSALRFRFKHDRHRSLRDRTRRKLRKHTRRESHGTADGIEKETEAAHPFPREPTSHTAEPSDDAFLSSLLDALADDEAASYWESVYSQPIHTFERPGVEVKEDGGVERMSDEEYAAWVKQKMWEKTHPEEVYERDKAKARAAEEEESKRKRREQFVRQRQRDAWTRASRNRPLDDEFSFDFGSTNRDADEGNASQWQHAWAAYLQAWEKLKDVDISKSQVDASKLLPWPVLPTKPATRPHIEEFLNNMPTPSADARRRLLKLERVRWHPDKIQQRFQGKVSEGTMKVVTGIFQVIDAMWTADFGQSG